MHKIKPGGNALQPKKNGKLKLLANSMAFVMLKRNSIRTVRDKVVGWMWPKDEITQANATRVVHAVWP
jgi:hypothetical protein